MSPSPWRSPTTARLGMPTTTTNDSELPRSVRRHSRSSASVKLMRLCRPVSASVRLGSRSRSLRRRRSARHFTLSHS